MRFVALVVILWAAASGCEKPRPPPEPTYQGRPLSAWVVLTGDGDPTTRESAFEAIRSVGGDAPAIRTAILAGAQDSSPRVRRAAAWAARGARGDNGPVTKLVREDLAAVRRSRGGDPLLWLCVDVEFMGSGAAGLAPEIRQVAASLDPASREEIERSLRIASSKP